MRKSNLEDVAEANAFKEYKWKRHENFIRSSITNWNVVKIHFKIILKVHEVDTQNAEH